MGGLAWPKVPPTLSDGTVTLRAWAATDAEAVFVACQDPDIQRWTRVPVPYRAEHASTFVGDVAPAGWAARSAVSFAIVSAGDGRLLGSCGLPAVHLRDLVGEGGYWIAPWARGRKVAQRGVSLLCDWALGDGGLDRLEFYVDLDNGASRAVVSALGCQLEGVLRRKVLVRGARRDTALYALLP